MALLAIIDYVIFSVIDSVKLIVDNKIAVLQMYNDDSTLVAYRLYTNNVNLIYMIIIGISILIILLVFKKKKNKNKDMGEEKNDEENK